jgi:hypothetical protein
MPTLPNGVSQSDFDAFVARYGVPPYIGGGSGEGEGEGDGGAGDAGKGGSEGAGTGADGGKDDAAAKALRAERRRAEAAEKRLKEIEDRDKSELQKAQERAEAAEKLANETTVRIRELAAKDVIRDAAIEAGGKRPAAIFELVKGKLVYGDDGSISNVKDVIAQAKKDVPELFGISGNGNAGQGNAGQGAAGGAPATDMNALIRRAAGQGSTN